MPEASLLQYTSSEAVEQCLQGNEQKCIALYVGSSDPLRTLPGAVPAGHSVTTVTGGCEYPPVLLLNEPSTLDLCDISPIATAMAEVKLRCLRLVDRQDFVCIWNQPRTLMRRTRVFERHIRPLLSPAAATCVEALSNPQVFKAVRDRIEKREGFAMSENGPCPNVERYEALQDIAQQTEISLTNKHLFDMQPPVEKPHTLYISNVGIVHDATRHYATRLLHKGWKRVLFTARDYAEDEYGSKLYTRKDGAWRKKESRQWSVVEEFHDCSFRVLGHEEGVDFPLLVECTPGNEKVTTETANA